MHGVEPRLLDGSPGSLYLRPLVLNIHNYMATLVSTVLTPQKRAIYLQVCLVWGYHHHQNDCPDNTLGELSHGFLIKEPGHSKTLAYPHFCTTVYASVYVPWNVFHVPFPNRMSSVNRSAYLIPVQEIERLSSVS